MARVSKKPEERRNEILDAAEELFLVKGYENTSVNEIVKKVGVAQGLFYYYFKAKDEILNAIAQKYINHLLKGVIRVIEEKNKNAVDKIHGIIDETIKALGLEKKGTMKLAQYVHREENSVMHMRMANRVIEQMHPYVASIVRQGVEEKLFDTPYPEEVASILLMWAGLLHNNIKLPLKDRTEWEKKAKAAEDIVERILGAKKGSINITKYVGCLFYE